MTSLLFFNEPQNWKLIILLPFKPIEEDRSRHRGNDKEGFLYLDLGVVIIKETFLEPGLLPIPHFILISFKL